MINNGKKKEKICGIKVYKFTIDGVFYRAETEGSSVSGRTMKSAINNLLKHAYIFKQRRSINEEKHKEE